MTGTVKRGVAAALALAVLCGTPAPLWAGAGASDSLAYARMREKIPAADSLRMLFETADALAGQGLYAEAMDMLRALGPRDSVRTISRRAGKWRVSTGADYYHLEDIDSAGWTQEDYEEYRRLTETPLSVWIRCRYETAPLPGLLEKAGAEAFVSTYKGRLEVPIRITAIKNLLSLETAFRADKWFRASASDSTLAPGAPQPSDMAGALLRALAEPPLSRDAAWHWSVPLSAEAEHFRTDRPGYESSADFRLTPSIEHRFGNAFPLVTRAAGEVRYDWYYKKETDSLSAFRAMARLENILNYPAGLHAALAADWMGDRYDSRHAPVSVDRWDASLRTDYGARERFKPGLAVLAMAQNERFAKTDTTAAYSLPGSELSMRPWTRFYLTKAIFAEPELLWNRRWSEKRPVASSHQFIWEAYRAWEPGLRLGISSFNMDVSARAAYRSEDVDGPFEEYISDSRSFKASLDGTLSPLSLLSITVFADYQYSVFAPPRPRVAENLTVSGSVAFKW